MNRELLKQLENICLRTDSYKITHWRLEKPGTTYKMSYLESRGGKFDRLMTIGLQYYLSILEGPIVTTEFIAFAKMFSTIHFGFEEAFNEKGWIDMMNKYHGHLPVRICAVPEGSIVPVQNALVTIESTDPEFVWIVQYIESIILKIWYTITVATYSYMCRKAIEDGICMTGGLVDPDLFWRMHDFGYRGASSEETAGIGGMCHLFNSTGTDNVRGILFAMIHYDAPIFCGGSVFPTEHTIATPFGLNDNGEIEYIKHMINAVPKDKVISVVGDSKDIYNFAWLLGNNEEVKAMILERTAPFVLRPDSGDPREVLTKVFNILWDAFGGVINAAGFKVLDPRIRVLQGDGVEYESIVEIVKCLVQNKFAVENIIFGSGGKLIQAHDRDEQKFAIKTCFQIINEEEVNVEKNPVTSPGKRSKKGRVKLVPSEAGFHTITSTDRGMTPAIFNGYVDAMVPVFENGLILKTYTWEEVKANISRTEKLYKKYR